MRAELGKRRYLFSDESGDLQCRTSTNVSKYFAVGTLLIEEDELARLRSEMAALRDELAWSNQGLDSCFHATEDSYVVRDRVFNLLQDFDFRVDVTLLQKNKAQPQVRRDEPTFFKYAWYFHLKYLAPQIFQEDDEVLIVAAELGTKKVRKAFRGAIEDVMSQCLHFRVKRTLAFWRDESDFALMAVDYCLWAVFRKWERGDETNYKKIEDKVRTEYDLWGVGTTAYF
ncbi:DUF3800 domain-containing protein [Streptomyces sp. NPDC047981]|uniref:DUF3800 domain-containing protein n=1 Tax=Streptomyces sp. NPDC047981 TaxID=3154610 RepID=UPI00343306F7